MWTDRLGTCTNSIDSGRPLPTSSQSRQVSTAMATMDQNQRETVRNSGTGNNKKKKKQQRDRLVKASATAPIGANFLPHQWAVIVHLSEERCQCCELSTMSTDLRYCFNTEFHFRQWHSLQAWYQTLQSIWISPRKNWNSFFYLNKLTIVYSRSIIWIVPMIFLKIIL